MQLLSRYDLHLATAESRQVTITTSLYRKSVDAGYQQFIKSQLAEGVFDNYILTLVQALLSSGKVSHKMATLMRRCISYIRRYSPYFRHIHVLRSTKLGLLSWDPN